GGFYLHHRLERYHHARRGLLKRLRRLHQIQIVIRLHLEDLSTWSNIARCWAVAQTFTSNSGARPRRWSKTGHNLMASGLVPRTNRILCMDRSNVSRPRPEPISGFVRVVPELPYECKSPKARTYQ